jgi:hypothetical protein
LRYGSYSASVLGIRLQHQMRIGFASLDTSREHNMYSGRKGRPKTPYPIVTLLLISECTTGPTPRSTRRDTDRNS